jgi:predicted nuclease with TOPRIM domain
MNVLDKNKNPYKKTSGFKALENAQKKAILGFEIWELLMAFTITLTVASSILWFSSYRSRYVDEEFIWQDQAKTRLYNLSLRADHNINPSKSSCNNLIKEDNLQDCKQKITEIRNEFDTLNNQIKENAVYLNPKPNLSELAIEYDKYFQAILSDLEKNVYISKKTIELQKSLTQSCEEKKAFKTDLINELEGEISKNEKTDSILKSLDKNAKKVKEEDLTPENIEAKCVELKPFLELKDTSILIDYSSQKYFDSGYDLLSKYEDWQSQYTSQEPQTMSKVVFITKTKTRV